MANERNIENITALADFIEASPMPFDMGNTQVATCDTAGCIAGFAAALWPECEIEGTWDDDAIGTRLGIRIPEIDRLFYPGSHYPGNVYPLITRDIAVEALRHFAASGEIRFNIETPTA